MLNKIIEFSINNKLIIGLMTVGLIGYGIFQITKLPIDAISTFEFSAIVNDKIFQLL